MHQTLLKLIIGFEWDKGNLTKSESKHDVLSEEAEQVFINKPLVLHKDTAHSGKEERYQVLGQTNEQQKLFVAFTIRNHKIRIISVRPMSRGERIVYEKEIEKDSKIQR